MHLNFDRYSYSSFGHLHHLDNFETTIRNNIRNNIWIILCKVKRKRKKRKIGKFSKIFIINIYYKFSENLS